MSTTDDRLSVIKQNYIDAITNEPNDLATAQTAADVTAIQANVASAKSVYFSALASELTATSAAADQAYTQAKEAVKSVQDARDAAASFSKLLDKLTNATDAATKLLNVASSVDDDNA